MDHLDMLRTFIAVADQGSFTDAARHRRISPTAASRAIGSLEASLGIALFHRTTRTVRLTGEGAAYLERCRLALAELDEAALAARGAGKAPGGTMVITAPILFGRLHVLPLVAGLLRVHPALSIRMMLVDRVVRLADEGVDLAIRIGALPDSTLHAVKLADVRRILVASPSYVAARGVPTSIAALRDHDLIAFAAFDAPDEWHFGPSGKPAIRIDPRLAVNSADAAIAAAEDGMGITRVLSYQALDSLAAGRLISVLDDVAPPPLPVHLVYQPNRGASTNVRAFIDAARRHFQALGPLAAGAH